MIADTTRHDGTGSQLPVAPRSQILYWLLLTDMNRGDRLVGPVGGGGEKARMLHGLLIGRISRGLEFEQKSSVVELSFSPFSLLISPLKEIYHICRLRPAVGGIKSVSTA